MSVAFFMPTRGSVYHKTIERCYLMASAKGFPFPVFVTGNASVGDVRNRIVQMFLNTNASVLFMLDDDVVPPLTVTSLVDRVLAGEAEIAAAPVPIVRPGTIHVPNVFAWNAQRQTYHTSDVYYGASGWQIVPAVGAGCLAIHRDVLENSHLRAPFSARVDRNGQITMGEDLNFCRRATAQGYTIGVDFGLYCDHLQTLEANGVAKAYLDTFNAALKEDDEPGT